MFQPKIYKLNEDSGVNKENRKYVGNGYKNYSVYRGADSSSGKSSSVTDITSVGSTSVGSKKPTVIYVDENGNECNEHRIRRVVRAQARHVTVVSYSRRQKESHSHTSHHVTTVSFPQRLDRSSPGSYSPYSLNYQINQPSDNSIGIGSNYSYIQQSYSPQPQHIYPQNFGSNRLVAGQNHHYHHHNHHNHQQNNVVTSTSSQTNSNNHQKKLSIRTSTNGHNGDVIKRTRTQNGYELSQDLLDKQIELLERKYGGIRARKAALTIQRAFRRYIMDRRFAAITANAKADKRTSYNYSRIPSSQSLEMNHHDIDSNNGLLMKGTPTRSMSLRGRGIDSTPSTPLKSPGIKSSTPQHPYVNLMHQQQQQQYYFNTPPSQYHHHQQLQYQNQSLMDSSVSSTSMNSSWHNSSGNQQPQPSPLIHYTAAQIYMRPRSSLNNSNPNISGQLQQPCSPNSFSKRPPPEVPKRTSSVISTGSGGSGSGNGMKNGGRSNGLSKSGADNGSLCSVQSSGSDSSVSVDKMQYENLSDRCSSSSPLWKRKEHEDDTEANQAHAAQSKTAAANNFKLSETVRKRQYRVGLNLFNKKPEKGVAYLVKKGFLESTPVGVAKFLISRKGLSRQMIGEYLGNLQQSFNMAVLDCFVNELDLSGTQVDVALRKFQGYFRMPGEAQKIERLMEVFSQRYAACNSDIIARLRSSDTIFVLAFAIIMLNTDLHTPNLKPERRMRCDDFIKNLRGVDEMHDIDREMLQGIYERVKANEFKAGSDHVTQVMKVQATIVGKKPNLALPHRRLVCYCRLYEVPDTNKKERPGVHQREVFLFNDLLVITKIFNKKKASVTYSFRISHPLNGMMVNLVDSPNYPHCIQLSQKVDSKVLVTFNARNEHDRIKFAQDLQESIYEMDEMEQLRIESELERQKSSRNARSSTNGGTANGNSENRDSGVADVDNTGQYQLTSTSPSDYHQPEVNLKRNTLSNSLLDMNEQFGNEKPQRRGSVGSLDSGTGISLSFHSTSASTGSRNCDPKIRQMMQHQQQPNFHGQNVVMQHNQNQSGVSTQGPLFTRHNKLTSRTSSDGQMTPSPSTKSLSTSNSGSFSGRSTEV